MKWPFVSRKKYDAVTRLMAKEIAIMEDQLALAYVQYRDAHNARISETLPQQGDTGGANATEETTK